MDADANDRMLWEEFRGVIARHNLSGDDAIDTVNRLLRKNPWLRHSGATLQIPKTGLRVSVESWELSRLWQLIHLAQVTPDEPASTGGAVLILRWSGFECLLDGRRRVNLWQRNNVAGPHRALVLENVTQ